VSEGRREGRREGGRKGGGGEKIGGRGREREGERGVERSSEREGGRESESLSFVCVRVSVYARKRLLSGAPHVEIWAYSPLVLISTPLALLLSRSAEPIVDEGPQL
jgi:hypothetical protein